MKRFLALSCALALTFSTTVCAAETVVPAKDFPILDKLAEAVDKSIPEYTSNAVCEMDGVDDVATIAQGDGCVLDGQQSGATFIVDKVDVGAIRYAQDQADAVGGKMLTVVEVTAPGVDIVNAVVPFTVEGVKAGDTVSVFKAVEGVWQAVEVTAVADESVTIKVDSAGIFTFINSNFPHRLVC